MLKAISSQEYFIKQAEDKIRALKEKNTDERSDTFEVMRREDNDLILDEKKDTDD